MYGILFWLSYLNCWPWRQNKLHITVISKELLANNNVSQEWICIAAVMQHGRDCITEIVFILQSDGVIGRIFLYLYFPFEHFSIFLFL